MQDLTTESPSGKMNRLQRLRHGWDLPVVAAAAAGRAAVGLAAADEGEGEESGLGRWPISFSLSSR